MEQSGYKLKLTSKRLKSGRCQIKFTISHHSQEPGCYGYLLAESGSTLRQVIETIEERVHNFDNPEWRYHKHLYSLQDKQSAYAPFLLYKAS